MLHVISLPSFAAGSKAITLRVATKLEVFQWFCIEITSFEPTQPPSGNLARLWPEGSPKFFSKNNLQVWNFWLELVASLFSTAAKFSGTAFPIQHPYPAAEPLQSLKMPQDSVWEISQQGATEQEA
jgi:hypothetical protein